MSSAARVHTPLAPPAGDTGPGDSGTWRRRLRARFHRDSPLWLVLVAGLFLLAEFSPTLLRMQLGADEITYIAQTSVHASQVILPPVHSRGAAVLAAPVTLLTTSVLALRVWMAVLSAIGLFLALLAWRGLRPCWVLAVAGLLLGSLGIAQLSGVQAMPDWWVALGALAVTGLFIQAVTGRMRDRLVLPLLAATTFFLVLLRPQDSAFLLAGMIAAALIVPGWRNRRVLAAIGIGILAGAVEWLGEAYAWYGGPVSRLHMMRQEPPKFALYFSLPYQLRVLNGPWYCRPGQCHSWDFPSLTVWWVVLLGLVVLGLVTARRVALASSMITVVAALSVLAAYTLFVPYAAPRYLLPVLALLMIPAADGIAWLATVPSWRAGAVVAICAFLLAGALSQQFVRRAEVRGQYAVRTSFITHAHQLRALGVRPPCVVSSPSTAYYLGCLAPWTGQRMSAVLAQAPGGAASWRQLSASGLTAYVRR
jgi:hypothetical protein